jgi:outer membrane protein
LKPTLRSLLLCASLWPLSGHAAPLDLPVRPGVFWQQLDTLPLRASPSAMQTHAIRFASLAELTEHALRERPASRAAWLGIQAEAARLDAASAANWPTLTGQLSFIQSRALSSSGTAAPTLNRYGPSLSLAYVLYDFGVRAASIDVQRYQLIASLLNSNRTLQDAIAEVEAAYYALLDTRAQVEALAQLEIALRASLDAAEARLQGGLVSRADQLRARAALAEANSRARRLSVTRPRPRPPETGGWHRTDAPLVLDWKPRRLLRWRRRICW